MRRARHLGQTGTRMAEAVEVNSRILELAPHNLPALTRRGLAYLKLDNYPAAREDLSRALRLYPGSSLVAEALKKIDRGWDAALERARRGPAEDRKPAKKGKPRRPRSSPRRSRSRRQIAEEARQARSQVPPGRERQGPKARGRRGDSEESGRGEPEENREGTSSFREVNRLRGDLRPRCGCQQGVVSRLRCRHSGLQESLQARSQEEGAFGEKSRPRPVRGTHEARRSLQAERTALRGAEDV